MSTRIASRGIIFTVNQHGAAEKILAVKTIQIQRHRLTFLAIVVLNGTKGAHSDRQTPLFAHQIISLYNTYKLPKLAMGNDISFEQDKQVLPSARLTGSGVDPPASPGTTKASATNKAQKGGSHKASASVATEKMQNLRGGKRRQDGPTVSGHDVAGAPRHSRLEPVFRSASQVFPSQSELTHGIEATAIQKLKNKAYQAILLHASATGRNAVLDLSYNVSVNSCGQNGQRLLVTARGTPTVIVQEVPVTSQQAFQAPLPPISIPAY